MADTMVPRFIKLVAKDKLDRRQMTAWLDCVRDTAPSGVVTTVPGIDPTGGPKSVVMVRQTIGNKLAYVIPVTRDLSDTEVRRIVDAFANVMPMLDFDIETNETSIIAKDRQEISLDASKHLELCMAMAKQKHQDWLRERTDAGWRYGVEFDPTEKTHPLLRPWDELSDRFKVPDMTWPQKLVKMLHDHGYAVVETEALERLVGLAKG